MLKHKILITAILIYFTSVSSAQKNGLSILNDRFYLTFPDSAKNIARNTDIMSADPNTTNETRVVYDIGEKRIVFFAEELYLKSAGNLEEKLKQESNKEVPFSTKILYNLDSVAVIRLTPLKFDDKEQAILINSLIIKNSDSTLSKISVYLNPKAYKDKSTFDRITEQVFTSFKKGNRRLNLTERTESFNVLDTKTVLNLKLPRDYIVTIDKKYDFEVYVIKNVPVFGNTDQAQLIMYFGFHPSMFSPEYELTNFKTPDTDGEFMFQKIKWLNYKDESRNYKDESRKLILREQLFVDDDIQKDAKIHIAMTSGSQQKIDELSSIVKSLLLKYDK